MRRNNLCIVGEDEIEGVAIGRAVARLEDVKNQYKSDESGTILTVPVTVAKNDSAFKAVLTFFRFRWPKCTQITFYRKRKNKQVIYDMKKFLRKAGI